MAIRRSDPGLLVALDAMLTHRGVTAAARHLGVSQPALSAQLARLRDIFADDLLVGNAHGMVLTPRAEALKPRVHDLVNGMAELLTEEAGFEPGTEHRTFALAASDAVHAIVAPPVLRLMRNRAPNIRLTGLPLDPARLTVQLAAGEADLAIIAAYDSSRDMIVRELADIDYRVVWRADHPAIREPFDLDDFCTLDHVSVSDSSGSYHTVVDEALDGLGRQRRIVASLPSFLMVPALVRSTDLIAVIPSRLALLDQAGLRSARLPFAMPGVPIYMAWHERSRRDPGHRWFRELVFNQLKN